jgi:ABC-type maltose transport system permease subunit
MDRRISQLTTSPIIAGYIDLQEYMVEGLNAGSVKE